jgi:proline iminopeptidase
MKEALFAITVMLLAGVAELAAQDTAGAVERRSGIIEINGTLQPYLLEGRGVPCVVVGPAFHYAQFFSDNLKQHIQFVLVDAKNTWMADESVDLSDVTMATMVDEIDEVRQALGYEKICVLGCSVLGYWPLEYALAYPDHISHAVAIGTPPFYNAEFQRIRYEYMGANEEERRVAMEVGAALQANQQRLPDELLASLTPWDRFVMDEVRSAPARWHDPTYDPFWHFAGRQSYLPMASHIFTNILTDYDPRDRFAEVEVLVFLALGRYDFVVPYVLWEEDRHRLPELSYHLFDESAHYPMLEEQALFDEKLIEFIERRNP